MRFALYACSLVMLVAPAMAGDQPAAGGNASREAKGFYLEPGVGINWLDQEEGHPQPADAGYHLSLAGGYRFHRRWAVELHTGYLSNSLPETTVEDGIFTTTYEEDDLNQIPIVANLVFHLVTTSRLEPYLGGGVGGVFGSDKEDAGFDGALEFMAGVRYQLSERTDLGLSYRFIMVAAASMFAEEAVGNDSVNLALKFRV